MNLLIDNPFEITRAVFKGLRRKEGGGGRVLPVT